MHNPFENSDGLFYVLEQSLILVAEYPDKTMTEIKVIEETTWPKKVNTTHYKLISAIELCFQQ